MDTTLLFLLKEAAYAPRDPRNISKRNRYQEKPKHPPVVEEDLGITVKPLKDKPQAIDKLTPRGQNKNSNRTLLPFESYLHTWNTLSGTGYGRPYWNYKDNPWRA